MIRTWKQSPYGRSWHSNDGHMIDDIDLAMHKVKRPLGMPHEVLLNEIVEDRQKKNRKTAY